MNALLLCLLVILFAGFAPAGAAEEKPKVKLETNHGSIIIALYPDKAPKTVANFLDYVRSGFYDNTIFHRVIKGFMIQGGGFTSDMSMKSTKEPVENEADNGLKNERGTIAMARTSDPHSASSQFFINTVNNKSLNHRNKTPQGWGYCVFGKVVEGMDVVDTIEKLSTGQKGMHRDVPTDPAIITNATVVQPESRANSSSESGETEKTKSCSMAYTYEVDPAHNLVRIKVSGQDTVFLNKKRIETIVKDPLWKPGYNVLVDFRDTAQYDLSSPDVEELAALHGSLGDRIGNGKLAVVASSDIVYGVSRMWKTVTEGHTFMTTSIFRTIKEAEEWLGVPHRE